MRTRRFSSILFCCLLLPAIGRADLLPNGTFDHDLSGWTALATVAWSPFDANGSLRSGSALGTNDASGSSNLLISKACVAIIPGDQVVFGGKIYVPSPTPSGSTVAFLWADYYQAPGCSGWRMNGYGLNVVNEFDAWKKLELAIPRQQTAVSVSVSLGIWKQFTGGMVQAYFDDVYVRSAPGDFNMSGQTDVLWRSSSGAMSAWLMNGPAVAASGLMPTVSDTTWQVVGLGDFQRDGKSDVLWRNMMTGDNVLWFMNGLNAPVAAMLPHVPALWHIAAVGDVQNDAKADIVWRNNGTGANVIWLMDGPNVAASAMLPTVADPNWQVVGIGDFQGDGKSDILWRNISTGNNSIWFMDGANVALSAALPAMAPGLFWKVAGVADFQGDGKADVLWRNTFTGESQLWLMNGPAVAASFSLPTVPIMWSVALVGDFQGDGKADILWRNSVTGDNSVWLMNGPAIAASAALPNVNPAFSVVNGR